MPDRRKSSDSQLIATSPRFDWDPKSRRRSRPTLRAPVVAFFLSLIWPNKNQAFTVGRLGRYSGLVAMWWWITGVCARACCLSVCLCMWSPCVFIAVQVLLSARVASLLLSSIRASNCRACNLLSCRKRRHIVL